MKTTSLLRVAAVLATAVLVAGVWASSAQAATHSLSGNIRAQIGDGLPIPIGTTAVPNGKVKAVVGAIIIASENTIGIRCLVTPGIAPFRHRIGAFLFIVAVQINPAAEGFFPFGFPRQS